MRLGVTGLTGPTGSGKTDLLAELAEKYVWDRHRKVTRLYTCDGGAWGTQMQALIERRIVQPYKIRTRWQGGEYALTEETCLQACMGYWPERINVRTGVVEPGVKMLPPTMTRFSMKDPAGHVVKESWSQAGLTATVCTICKQTIQKSTPGVEIIKQSKATPGFDQVGAIFVEGLSSMSDAVMNAQQDRAGAGEGAGSRVISGDIRFGQSQLQHYGFAQSQADRWLNALNNIPLDLVVDPIITGHESRGEVGELRIPMYGPRIAGSAKLASLPGWMGNYLGAQVDYIGTPGGDKKRYRLCLSHYRDPDGAMHPYKTRAMARSFPDYLEDEDGAPPHSGHSLTRFFIMIEEQVEASRGGDGPEQAGVGEDGVMTTSLPEIESLKVQPVQAKVLPGPGPARPPQPRPAPVVATPRPRPAAPPPGVPRPVVPVVGRPVVGPVIKSSTPPVVGTSETKE